MSNQPPPPYGGHPNYAQQWPPLYPMGIPPPFLPNAEYAGAGQTASPNLTQNLDPNMASFYANSQLSVAPNQFNVSQLQAPTFAPIPGQSTGYPPMPGPLGSFIPPPVSAESYGVNANESVKPQESTSNATLGNNNREEGEVSEDESEPPVPSRKTTKAFNASKLGQRSRQHSELEEGETMSSGSPSSSRSSSPYNPPLSVSADTEAVSRAIGLQKMETSAKTTDAQPFVSAEQLRQRAQGALLSLKPHKISYEELVAEGLNPTILRKLYEQVGLKINPQPRRSSKSSVQPASVASKQAALASTAPGSKDQNRQKSSTAPPVPASTGSSASDSVSERPMERKEVIAKMLAAKAAKKAEGKEEIPPGNTKPVSASPSSTTPTLAPAPHPSQVKSTVVPVREKSKAQTELARQRIEELKRQALLKKAQSSQLSQLESPADTPTSIVSAQQHPLPVRPPNPQSSDAAPIPGLAMNVSKEDSGLSTPTDVSRALTVDPTPLARATQRKRPRASDFDENDTASKKHFVHENDYSGPADRLIIEFSDDDESLYADDSDDMEIDDDESKQVTSMFHLEAARPALQRNPSSISTPQGASWQSDNEHVRQKDLAIQEMHRKIAQLEERRKAKLAASQTESPRAVDDSGEISSSSASDGQSSPVDADVTTSSSPSTSKPAPGFSTTLTADGSNLIDSLSEASVRSLARMDMAELDKMRVAISSSKERPIRLPGLNTEVVSSEDTISGENQGSLFDELKHLIRENADLTLEDLDKLRRQAEVRSQNAAEKQDAPSPSQVSSSNVSAALSVQQASNSLVNSTQSQKEESASVSNLPGSTQDYSDSLDSDDNSSDPESPISVDNLVGNSDTAASHPLPEQPTVNGDVTMKDSVSQVSASEQSQRESSAESDESEAYEPPEPETVAEPDSPYSPEPEPGSPYSPPFSPAPPVSVKDDTKDTIAVFDEPSARVPLTDESRAAVLGDPQVGILGSQPSSSSSANTAPKFTPYLSPLRQFKAYRYHPGFTADVPNGYRSLTYSHDIDSMKSFCQYELAGGVCNDRFCGFQHFRDITLSDDKVLIEMGSVREGQTEEEKETYLAGLKEIINEMRRDKVKDFSTVASEIVAYRRRFLQDPSRVLPL
ncbi:uncharacterized protein N7483_000711 [Penicillium malachiteum]|uniref:uncharacterized protein n=1 Tax=Penicillium malachiteum TaxID=1324776 RepID=UPI00254728B8|nr:uncharacterized protein N7483_000711 [Penicillium malachiteum]KAJ5735586.1 hypothetical protein N7483_000711 [Penicillium malachiteum]